MKLLILDSHREASLQLAKTLGAEGHPTEVVHDQTSALTYLLNNFDIQAAMIDLPFISDATSPLLFQLRSQRNSSSLKLIVMMEQNALDSWKQAHQCGADDFLIKPVLLSDIKTKLGLSRMPNEGVVSQDSPQSVLPEFRPESAAHPIVPPPRSQTSDPSQKLGEMITPSIHPSTFQYYFGLDVELLDYQAKMGHFKKMVLDTIFACPRCSAIPTVRLGCQCCGSGRVKSSRLIHHFACAHIGSLDDFEQDGTLICPKCRITDLVVGSDFEYMTGPSECPDCHWSGQELELICHCLGCSFRFPLNQAQLKDVVGYYVHRVDVLDQITAPQ